MVVLNRYFSTTKRTADVSLKLLQKIIIIKLKQKNSVVFNKLCMYINPMCENKTQNKNRIRFMFIKIGDCFVKNKKALGKVKVINIELKAKQKC